MIKRIVKLTFHPEHISTFLEIFEESRLKIAHTPGCRSVSLLQGVEQSHICFTYSVWESAEDLENYRHSQLFKATWSRTKVLFADKPEAWSTKLVNGAEDAGL